MGAWCSRSLGLPAALTSTLWVALRGRQCLWSTKPASTLILVTFEVNLAAAGSAYYVSHLCLKTVLFNVSRERESGEKRNWLMGVAKTWFWKVIWDALSSFVSNFTILLAVDKGRFGFIRILPGVEAWYTHSHHRSRGRATQQLWGCLCTLQISIALLGELLIW